MSTEWNDHLTSGKFQRVTCRNWRAMLTELRRKLDLFPAGGPKRDKWVFRGETDATRALSSTFEREAKRFKVPPEDRPELERSIIREFRRRAYHYGADLPAEDRFDEWLALMRHHGAPVRYVDWTYSPFVALYFALANAEVGDRIAVWALNTDWCVRQLEHNHPGIALLYSKYQEKRDGNFFRSALLENQVKMELSINPFRFNDRLTLQQGVFICPGDTAATYEENIRGLDEWFLRGSVVQYVLRIDRPFTRDEGLLLLHRMNITEATLFPGMDGFARSLGPRIPQLRKQVNGGSEVGFGGSD
ncbi:MAG: FRG domain-containing protein [SAR202 cluster bacterium]|nr:FRG domain-containing protein [SAR202 cluster bacterium]